MRYFILLLAFVLGACTAAPIVEPEPTDPLDAAVKYYISEERRRQFDRLLDDLEQVPGQAMLEQRIPSFIQPHDPSSPLKRQWITYQTQPGKGFPFISFTTRRDSNDKADLADSQGFSTWKCNKDFQFFTKDIPIIQVGSKVKTTTLGPLSYSWSIVTWKRGGIREFSELHIRSRNGDDLLLETPLEKRLSLYKIVDHTGNPVAKEVIKALDADFIDEVRGLDLSNSDCASVN